MAGNDTRAPLETTGRGLLDLENSGPIQMGFWVPNRIWATAKFLKPLRRHISSLKAANELAPVNDAIASFKNWVTGNSVYRMWVNSMIEQANVYVAELAILHPEEYREISADGDTTWIAGYDEFFEILNEIINTSPSFNDTAQVGTPMNGFLAVAMGTAAGAALFHDKTFNEQMKAVLDAWNRFLKSPASLDKLDISNPEKPGSWISEAALSAGVWEQMEHDASLPGYGYDSWNAFFIRQFVPGARPFKGDPASQIDIGCETTPWQYEDNVAFETGFWVKDVNYSLLDLFGGRDTYANLFVGGQLYQGFLSATHYHRWNAPLDGKVIASWVEPGTYFAQRPAQGESQGTWEGTESQPYLGHVASRAIFIFEHATCGYVALICIGMVEVSTCVIEPQYLVSNGQAPVAISRGDEIGHFEFGGSTHMMIFQRDKVVLEQWARDAVKHQSDKNPTPMGTVIASAISR
jgi:phosphatidylserine decarboxylase